MSRWAYPAESVDKLTNKKQIWDDQSQVDHVMSYCPEVKMILGMKLDNDKPKGIPWSNAQYLFHILITPAANVMDSKSL
jgi:hypothetical protein